MVQNSYPKIIFDLNGREKIVQKRVFIIIKETTVIEKWNVAVYVYH